MPTEIVRVRVLGGFEVTVGDRPIVSSAWQRSSALRLFKALLVAPGHRLRREVAADRLWPETSPELARSSLRKALHFATRALLPSDLIGADATAIWLDHRCLELDLDDVESALQSVARGGSDAAGGTIAEQTLDRALERGAGELLPDDQYEDWLVGPRDRLRTRWQRLAFIAAERALDAGRFAEAHALAARLIDCDPADEQAHQLAIGLYLLEGRRSSAFRQLARCREGLTELGLEPLPETIALLGAAERTQDTTTLPRDSLAARPLEGERCIGFAHAAAKHDWLW